MQWNGSENAGFTTGTPWLRVNPRYPEINLETDKEDPAGIFRGYQELLRLRKEHPVIPDGKLRFYLEDAPQIIAYTRGNADETLLILANLSGEEAPFELPRELSGKNWKVLFRGRPECEGELPEKKSLAPWESLVLECLN